jgi:hypothetical protein
MTPSTQAQSPVTQVRSGEAVRRAVIWLLVAAFFTVGVWGAVADPGGWWVVSGWSGFVVVGAMILNSRPGNGVGRLLMLIGLGWVAPNALWTAGSAGAFPAWAAYIPWVGLILLVVAFPVGRATTRTGLAFVVLALAMGAIIVAADLLDTSPLDQSGRPRPWAAPALDPVIRFLIDGGGFFVVPLLMFGALVELAVRWRRAEGAQRLQYRWFAFGVAVAATAITVSAILPDDIWVGASVAIASCLNAIPVCIGIAVTRHGLYEIGRVVSRTVSYAAATAAAVGIYTAVVTSVTWVFPDAPSIAVAAATLVAAALALPLLRATQRLLDRHFDRERYDAQRVVEAFGERLRSQVDASAVTGDLAAAVDTALAPSALGLWTAGGPR